MADAIFLVTRTDQGVTNDRNQVREVVIFNDDGDADALIIQNTVDALNTAQPVETGAEDAYPIGYFDTVEQIGATPTGFLDTEFDFLAFAPRVAALTSA